jgi:predicted amidophosphoribosyltransferase
LLSRITFGSFLVYAPRGTSELSNKAKQFVRALKEERFIGTPPQSPSQFAARRFAERHPNRIMEEVFGAAPLLVPVPRSSRPVDGGIWPAYNIASALVANGIGTAVLPCLQRVKAVPKSAFATLGTRPKPLDHYASIAAAKMVADREELCLVDDVITKGATLLAAASRLRETYPNANIVAFALVRTMGFVDDIDRMIEPAVGTITLRGDDAVRDP